MHTDSNRSPHNETSRLRAATANTMASFKVVPSGAAVGAEIRGVDLSLPVPEDVKEALRKAWADHMVLLIRGQTIDDDHLEAASLIFGPPHEPASRQYHVDAGHAVDDSYMVSKRKTITIISNLDANGKLVFGASDDPMPRFEVLLPPLVRAAPVGAVFEWRPDTEMMKIATRVRHQDGAALIIDYGHLRSDAGDTFQAIARHSFADPLKNPGQADVTAHVDFQALARAAEDVGARVHGPVTQGDFLKRLGIETRALTLMGKTTPEVSADISAALKRLTDSGRGGMGSMFKVIGISQPDIVSLAGLSDETQGEKAKS